MADWTTPKTWNVGDILTAADMNTYTRDNTPQFLWKITTKTLASTTETDMLNGEITLAANVMGSNRRLRGVASMDWINNTGGGIALPRFKLKLGATTLIDTGVGAPAADVKGANRKPIFLRWEIQQLNATNAQDVVLDGFVGFDSTLINGTTGVGYYTNVEQNAGYSLIGMRNTTAVDMTSAQALTLNTTIGLTHANVDLKLYWAKVAIGV